MIKKHEKDDQVLNDEIFSEQDFINLSKKDQQSMIDNLTKQMQDAAQRLEFEEAATLRDTIMELKAKMKG